MKPGPNTPRLATLTPESVALDVVGDLRARIVSAGLPLQPAFGTHVGLTMRADGSLHHDLDATIARLVVQLAVFAKTGDAGDWRKSNRLQKGAIEGAIAEINRDVPSPRPELDLVIAAARGRLAWEEGQALTAEGLAALAGLSPQQIRLLARNGELPGGLPMPAREAGNWLTAKWKVRGVHSIHSIYIPQLPTARRR